MRILVTGATGLVGSELTRFLRAGGHEVLVLTRREPSAPNEVRWDPRSGVKDPARIEGLDAVVHLAGEGIAAKRWSDAQKREIEESRVVGTTRLVESLAGLAAKPRVFVSASAIGFYGNRGDELLDEGSSSGNDFLSGVCRKWEEASGRAGALGARVVALRFGVILSGRGGALKKMLLPFKLGAGGKLGSGSQWMSWVALDDVVGAIHHALLRDDLSGPVNVTAPEPVRNSDFTKTLGKVLSRPTVLPMPTPMVKIAFGELGEALLLSSQRVVPRRLSETGFDFAYPRLEGALRHVLGRGAASEARPAHA